MSHIQVANLRRMAFVCVFARATAAVRGEFSSGISTICG